MENQIIYTGNGSINEFAFNFKIFKADNTEVYLNGLKQISGYHVQLEDTGGIIIFQNPPSSNSKILIRRFLKSTRQCDFQECGIISSTDLNSDMDYMLELIRQTNSDLEKCARLDPLTDDINMQLPNPVAGHCLTWDDKGKALINSKLNLMQESLLAQKACSDTKEIFQNLKTLLGNSNDATALGLVFNMLNAFKEKFPDVYEDCGNILEQYGEHRDIGTI